MFFACDFVSILPMSTLNLASPKISLPNYMYDLPVSLNKLQEQYPNAVLADV
jgi:hypothetical protein